MRSRFCTAVLILLAVAILPGCGKRSVRTALRDADSMLEDRPAEALALLEQIDSTSLRFKPLRMRYSLLYAIALDKAHVDDGCFVRQMAEAASWYDRFGNRRDKLRALYYYGDQLRGAGLKEEAAVHFMRSESEAVAQKNWFLAGMSARSLYYVFAESYNGHEELLSIKRAVDYFHQAHKEVHEDDARVKLALAYYDNSELENADSVYNVAIKIARQKRDTVRWRQALINSVDVMLADEPFRADSALASLLKAEELGFKPGCRTLADYALCYACNGDRQQSERCLADAYSKSVSEADEAFVVYRDYEIRRVLHDTTSAFPLLSKSHSYVNNVSTRALRQSVMKAQNNYLLAANEELSRERLYGKTIIILMVLLTVLLFCVNYLIHKRKEERHRLAEEYQWREIDNYRQACQELISIGLGSLDELMEAYYSSGNRKEEATYEACKSIISKFRSDREFQAEFMDKVDRTHGYVITKLKEQLPSISDKQLMLFSYIVCGFSYTCISVAIDDSPKQYMYTRKNRLIKMIEKNSPADKDAFLAYLTNRPSNSRK